MTEVRSKAQEPSATTLAVVDIASGTIGGLAQVVAGHPLDTVKVRLQMQRAGSSQFGGVMDCFRQTCRQEGVRGLYKGALSPALGAMLHNANVFFAYGQATSIMKTVVGNPEQLTLKQVSLVECPMDLVKCKMQAQIGAGKYTGTLQATRLIYATHGIRGLYQGMGATLFRNVPCFGSYFLAFETTKRLLTKEGEEASLAVNFVAGGAAGFGDYDQRIYRSALQCWRATIREEGLLSLWKGYVPCLARAVLVNAVIFTAVAAAKKAMLESM